VDVYVLVDANRSVRHPMRGRVLLAGRGSLLGSILPDRYLVNKACGEKLPEDF
jgi:hypothetical protein